MKRLLSSVLAVFMFLSLFVIGSSAQSYSPLGGWKDSGEGPIIVNKADPADVVKDGVIGENEYEQLMIDQFEDETPLHVLYVTNDNLSDGLDMLATIEFWFSWDEIHGFNFAIKDKPAVIQQLLDAGTGAVPGDDFANNTAFVLNMLTENSLESSRSWDGVHGTMDVPNYCLYYAVAKRTDTGHYLEGYYDKNQLGLSGNYDPEAGVDYVIGYTDDGYVILEWSVPFSCISSSPMGAGSSICACFTATAGNCLPGDDLYQDVYGIGLGDNCFMVDAKIAKSGTFPEFILSDESLTSPFTDVRTDAYYFTPVVWYINQPNIDLDAEDELFLPNNTGCSLTATKWDEEEPCVMEATRGGVMYMLWWLAGCPEPVSTNNPFRDLSSDAYYYKASLWAVEKEITKGTSATTFSPDILCTKGQIVTFLYRALNEKNYGSYTITFNPEHNYSDWTPVSECTCTEVGTEERACTRCGKNETRNTEPLGHEFKEGVCVRCGYEFKPEFEYTVMNGEATVTRYRTKGETEIEVPAELGGYPVTGIGKDAFSVVDYVYSGVTYYNKNSTLESVRLPDSVTSIGNSAFYGCSGLTGMTVPDGVTSIGNSAFSGCTGLTNVTIGDSVTSIGDDAFWGCTSLESVTIPDSVTSIGRYAFNNCRNLTSVTIPDSVTSIDAYTFYGCTSLESVKIPGSVTSIAYESFAGCSTLESIELPESLKSIEYSAFSNCYSIEKVYYAGTESNWNNRVSVAPGNNDLLNAEFIFEYHIHVPVFVPEKQATCTENGNIGHWRCTVCGKYYTDEKCENEIGYVIIASPGHDYTGSVTAPTCTERGYTTYTCLRCGDSYVDDYIDALGHTPAAAVRENEKSATCTADGSYDEVVYCSVCGAEISRERKTVAALGHDYVDSITAPTCTEKGYTTHTCKVCGEAYVDSEVAALGHDYGADGNAEKCSRCGEKNPDYKPPVNFKDVKPGAYYADAVAWAVAKGVTTGTSATTFSPNDGCTRGQVVAFLWRAAGSPEPKGNRNPFSDVKSNAYYYKAVLWAVENEVTSGTDATHFSPNSVCTRGQIVTFLWRANGKPAPSKTANPFKDVKASDYYYDAVLWAVEKDITLGTDAAHFSPSSTCTRGQVVAFLYRAMAQ